jgi:hypothetical protein
MLTHGDRIIGENKALAIQFGPGDMVTVRESSADVVDAVNEINKVVEEAKTDETESGYVRPSFSSTIDISN